jgi:hypothetical protein
MKASERVATKDSANPKDSLGALKVPLGETCGVAEIWWALAQADGMYKYGQKNWRNKKVRISVYLEAIRRHTMALIAGEDIDPVSKVPHSGHIMACCAIIEDARAAGCLIDDRREKDMAASVLNALTADNYSAATLALTRTPARTLDEVRGGPIDFAGFVGTVVEGQRTRMRKDKERQAAEAATSSQFTKARKSKA